MLNRFNSNTRQLNRIVKKYNLTNISASVYEGIEVSGSNNFKTIVGDYIFQSASLNDKYHDGKGTNLNPTGSETGSAGQGGYSNLPNELSASIEYEDNMTPEEILKNFENEVHMIIYFEERISFFENNCMYLQKRLDKFSDEVRDFCEDLFSSNNNLTSKLH